MTNQDLQSIRDGKYDDSLLKGIIHGSERFVITTGRSASSKDAMFVLNVIKLDYKCNTNKHTKSMKKTVKYNGENIKVNFTTINFTRVVDKMEGIRIVEAHGTRDFVVNEKIYTVSWSMKHKTKPSTQLHFEGFTCGDSEKKMIEHILEKYGI